LSALEGMPLPAGDVVAGATDNCIQLEAMLARLALLDAK
jgi:hypothetical protein